MSCSTTQGTSVHQVVPFLMSPRPSDPFSLSEMRDSMKSKRINRAEGDEEEEEEEEEGKGPAVATTAADSSALAMVNNRSVAFRANGRMTCLISVDGRKKRSQPNGSPPCCSSVLHTTSLC